MSSSGLSPLSYGTIITHPGSRSSNAFARAEKNERSCPCPSRACASLCASFRVSLSWEHAVLSAERAVCDNLEARSPALSISSSVSVSTSIEMCISDSSKAVPAMKGSANSAANAGCSQTGGGFAYRSCRHSLLARLLSAALLNCASSSAERTLCSSSLISSCRHTFEVMRKYLMASPRTAASVAPPSPPAKSAMNCGSSTNFSCSCGFGPAATSSSLGFPSLSFSFSFSSFFSGGLGASILTAAHSRPLTKVFSSPGFRVITSQHQRSARTAASAVPISLSAPTPPFLNIETFSTFSPGGGGAPPLKMGSVALGIVSSRTASTIVKLCSRPSSSSTHGVALRLTFRKAPSGKSSAYDPSSCSSYVTSPPTTCTPSGSSSFGFCTGGSSLWSGPPGAAAVVAAAAAAMAEEALPPPLSRGVRKSATRSTLDAAPSDMNRVSKPTSLAALEALSMEALSACVTLPLPPPPLGPFVCRSSSSSLHISSKLRASSSSSSSSMSAPCPPLSFASLACFLPNLVSVSSSKPVS